MATKRKPKKGDLVVVTWIDFATSDKSAEAPVYKTSGWFLEYKSGYKGHDLMVCMPNIEVHPGDFDNEVRDVYPLCGVLEVEVVE